MKEQEIKHLTDIEHVLLRPQMYIGQTTLSTTEEYITRDGKFSLEKMSYVPGLVKIFNELIDNSVDEYVRTKGQYANKITININSREFSIQDNGRGIPVKEVDSYKGCIWAPTLAWTELKAGSNFEDESSTTIGTNGVGSSLCSIFSKEFRGTSNDGNLKCTVVCQNNNEKINTKVGKPTGKQGVHVKIVPDVERFGLKEITDSHIKMIEQRLYNLSVSYPDIIFKLNDTKIKLNAKKFLSMFGEGSEGTIHEEKNFSIGVFRSDSDDFKQFSLMNGLNLSAGGTHIDFISNGITKILRDKIIKKYKTIKPNDIKRKLFIVCIMKNFQGPKYETQTKEKLTNPMKEITKFFESLDMDKFADKVYKNKSIIDSIINYFKIAEEYKKKLEIDKLGKAKKKIRSNKYTRAVGSNKFLIICEGASAKGGLMPILGRDGIAYYELKGKPLNALTATHQKFTSNKELTELFQIIQNENFEYIVTGTDQDLDGIHITALITGFYKRYFPEDLKNGKLGRLQTPVFFTRGKDKKPKKWYYNLRDIPDETGEYMKGLGSWEVEDLEYIIKQDGLEAMINIFEDTDENVINEWLSTDSELRKKYIQNNDFELIKL